jgi:hypothetical protein
MASTTKPKLKTGKMTIRIHKAQKLYDTQTLSKQDPYASFELGDFKKATKVHQDAGREPVWEEEFTTQLTGFEFKLALQVLHKGLVGSDLIGAADIPLSQFLCGDLPPTWYRLGRDGKGHVFAGEVLISSKFVDDNKDSAENKEKAAQETIARLGQKIQFLEASIAQKESDIAEEEINHSKERDTLRREIHELKEKNAKLEAAAGKLAGMEKKMEKMIPDPVDEEYYENQRYMPLKGWQPPYLPTDRHANSNMKGTEERTRDHCKLPANWKWSTEWAVDVVRVGIDKDGWEYAKDFSTEFHSTNTKLDSVRRRRWSRRREFVVPQ